MTESSAASLIIYVGAPAILVIIFFIIAYSQKPDRLLTTKPSIIEPIRLNRPKPNVLDQIKARVLSRGFKMVAESQGAVVFADRPSIVSWGFFYPVYVRVSEKECVVEVEIKSRFRQDNPANPITSRKFREFVRVVEESIS